MAFSSSVLLLSFLSISSTDNLSATLGPGIWQLCIAGPRLSFTVSDGRWEEALCMGLAGQAPCVMLLVENFHEDFTLSRLGYFIISKFSELGTDPADSLCNDTTCSIIC